LANPKIKKEVGKYWAALKRWETPILVFLRPYGRAIGSEWFATLRMNNERLHDDTARKHQ